MRNVPGPRQAVTVVLLAAVAAVLAVRAGGIGRRQLWREAHNEKLFYDWAYGDRGVALRAALAGKEDLFRDAEVLCFRGPAVPAGRPRWDAVMVSYFLPRQIVLTPAALGARAADPLPCRTRVVESPGRSLVIERRSLDDRRP